jgi:hypothetical protein
VFLGVVVATNDRKLFHIEAGSLQFLHGLLGLRVRFEQCDKRIELLRA